MKKISFRLILAALAATAVLAACTKEPTPPPNFENDKVAPAAEGSRVITVTFGPQTKTVLDEDGLTPKFADGDSILLATRPQDKEAIPDTQTVAVIIDPSTQAATVTTTLQGELSAFYPARLAELPPKGGCDIFVPEEQSGLFKDANICSATIRADEGTAQFENVYPLLKIIAPGHTQKLTIKSLPEIGEGGQRTGDAERINDVGTGSSRYTVTVSAPILSMLDSIYYVALTPGAFFENLSFEAEFTDSTGAVKGIGKAGLEIVREKDTIGCDSRIKRGWAYTIDNNNWHDYVTIGGRKWATMNIGATSPEEPGEYFMWGEVKGHKFENDAWTNFPENNPDESRYNSLRWKRDSAFAGCNAPFVLSADFDSTKDPILDNDPTWDCTYSKYNTTDKALLELCDDAANVNWGGAWRMPTDEEFGALTIEWDSTRKGYKSVTSPSEIFIPAAGSGLDMVAPYLVGEGGAYWCSLHSNNFPDCGCYFAFQNVFRTLAACYRYYGMSIRAIVDEPDYDEIIDQK